MAGKKPNFNVQALDILGLGNQERPPVKPDPRDTPPDSGESPSARKQPDAPPNHGAEAPPPAGAFVVAPIPRKEAMTHARLTRLTKSLNDKVTQKLRADGLTYNHVVNTLLELWVESSN